MAKTVLNLTTGLYIKQSQADSWHEACRIAWVDKRTIRELDNAERLAMFADRSKRRQTIPEYLPPIEPNGCKFIPPTNSKTSLREIWDLVRQARQFCAEVG